MALSAAAFALALAFGPAAAVAAEGHPGEAAAERAEHAGAGQAEGPPHEGQEHAAGEHAAGGHEAGGIDAGKLALQLLNFGILVFILVRFGGKAVNKALAARHQQLKADLASASEARAAAEAQLARQEARLASLEQEIAALRRAIRGEADAEKARLIAAAEERAARIKAETAFLLDQQVREAELRLRREAALAGLAAAERLLRQSIGAGDQQKLVDTFIGEVTAPAPRAPAAGGSAPRGTV